MTQARSEICFIAPTDMLARRAAAIIQKRDLSIPVHTAVLEDAAEWARKMMEQGTWIFISRGVTRELIQRTLHTPVVNIPVVASDYIPAIQQVQNVRGPIAFFAYEPPSDELKTICYLMNIQMRHYQFSDTASCRACVQQAAADGAVWGIGGIVSAGYAKEAGLPYVLMESSDIAVSQAIENACQLCELQRENARKQEALQIQLERYQNILNYTHDAIIAVDAQGRVEVTNQVAERLLGPSQAPFIGKPIGQVLPNTHMTAVLRSGTMETDQLMTIGGTLVSTNRVPIIVNDKIQGVVATFQDIKSIQSTERNVRIKLHEKGLLAKYRLSDIVGTSPALLAAKEMAQRFADAPFTVMLYGETGTGKEMFAQSIHNASPRRDGPFVAVNCTALSKSLLESELFGYADSSFTGAKRGGKPGLFEMAHGGTIFLDEIGELPLEFQAQFLRVLQEKEVRRVGGDTVIPVDIRVIGATNRDLMRGVEEGSFRRDLYYRLNVLTVNIPPLRDREDDFLQIADSIYDRIVPDRTQEERQVFRRILEHYRGYAWPGNVRELTNLVERIYLLQKQSLPEEKILDLLSRMTPRDQRPVTTGEAPAGGEELADVERAYIQSALTRNGGNISRTAQELHISRATLYRKLKKG
ncbi:sigma-54-dependent Fis family transcriptional regulator [uncultured Intestinimonas sp.]|uniref:sigma-54-dependent Fis family transcriptional regulator n=1 Tax=uncultured Intestinimonas sp. TaxID=1689265 RepID=UPI0025DCA247|nr:sigma-54-dependent Fis family transcriptional regulator [uncultured Intestinimonas sp.]